MFKLVKILNSSTTVPETIRIKTSANEPYTRGMLLKMNANGAAKNVVVGEMPTHVCCETLKAGESETVLCYEITEAMVFSAPTFGSMEGVSVGVKVTLEVDDDGYATCVTPFEDGGYVTIHNTCGATDSDQQVLVRFVK